MNLHMHHAYTASIPSQPIFVIRGKWMVTDNHYHGKRNVKLTSWTFQKQWADSDELETWPVHDAQKLNSACKSEM